MVRTTKRTTNTSYSDAVTRKLRPLARKFRGPSSSRGPDPPHRRHPSCMNSTRRKNRTVTSRANAAKCAMTRRAGPRNDPLTGRPQGRGGRKVSRSRHRAKLACACPLFCRACAMHAHCMPSPPSDLRCLAIESCQVRKKVHAYMCVFVCPGPKTSQDRRDRKSVV